MSETNQVNIISDETKSKLKSRSLFGLSNNPSEKGAKPEKTKDAIAGVVVGSNNSILSEMERIIAELNTCLSNLQTFIENHTANVNNPHQLSATNLPLSASDSTTILAKINTILNGTTKIGYSLKTDNDSNGNNIVSTYATKEQLLSEASSRQTTDSTIQNEVNLKLNKLFNDISLASDIAENDYFVINSGSNAYRVSFSKLKNIIGVNNSSGVDGDSTDHYKGDYLTLQALQTANPSETSNPGDYAFVNTTTQDDNIMVMYIWDLDTSTWVETDSDKYVGTLTFTEFQESLLNGDYVVDTAKNYSLNGTIASKFTDLESKIGNIDDLLDEINGVVI